MRPPTDEEKFTCPDCGHVNSKSSVIKEKPGKPVELPDGGMLLPSALPGLGLAAIPVVVRARCKKCKAVFVAEDRRRVYVERPL